MTSHTKKRLSLFLLLLSIGLLPVNASNELCTAHPTSQYSYITPFELFDSSERGVQYCLADYVQCSMEEATKALLEKMLLEGKRFTIFTRATYNNYRFFIGYTVLGIAVYVQAEGILKMLLEYVKNGEGLVDVQGTIEHGMKKGFNMFQLAALVGNPTTLFLLLEYIKDASQMIQKVVEGNISGWNDFSALHIASYLGKVRMVSALIDIEMFPARYRLAKIWSAKKNIDKNLFNIILVYLTEIPLKTILKYMEELKRHNIKTIKLLDKKVMKTDKKEYKGMKAVDLARLREYEKVVGIFS